MECFFGAPVAPAAGGAGRVFRKSGISAGGGQARPCRTQGSAVRAGPCCRRHGARQEQEEQQGKQHVVWQMGGSGPVVRPGRGSSGGHPPRPADRGRQEGFSGILESKRAALRTVRPGRIVPVSQGVGSAWRSPGRGGRVPCPAPRLPLLRKRCGMLAGDAAPLVGWLLQKRKETAGLPPLWAKYEKTVCILQDRG